MECWHKFTPQRQGFGLGLVSADPAAAATAGIGWAEVGPPAGIDRRSDPPWFFSEQTGLRERKGLYREWLSPATGGVHKRPRHVRLGQGRGKEENEGRLR